MRVQLQQGFQSLNIKTQQLVAKKGLSIALYPIVYPESTPQQFNEMRELFTKAVNQTITDHPEVTCDMINISAAMINYVKNPSDHVKRYHAMKWKI